MMESVKHVKASRRNYLKGALIGYRGSILQLLKDGAAATSSELIEIHDIVNRLQYLVDNWDENTRTALDKAYEEIE